VLKAGLSLKKPQMGVSTNINLLASVLEAEVQDQGVAELVPSEASVHGL
jgi:hypothetical protein